MQFRRSVPYRSLSVASSPHARDPVGHRRVVLGVVLGIIGVACITGIPWINKFAQDRADAERKSAEREKERVERERRLAEKEWQPHLSQASRTQP